MYVMLSSMLPEHAGKDVRGRKASLRKAKIRVEHVSGELARYNDKHMSVVQNTRELSKLDSAPSNAVKARVETEKRIKGM